MSDWFKDLFIGEAKAAVISKNNLSSGGGKPAVTEPLEVTENGTYDPASGVDGFNKVTVNVPDIPAVVEALEVTENGTYTPGDGVDGFSEVVVDVAGEGGEEWIGDGNTHIWIHLEEGRTSPMLGVGVNGTVTVDWGDGSTPDVLTGNGAHTAKWTPTHEYPKAGDYVITLTVDGEAGLMGSSSDNAGAYILRHSSETDIRNNAYLTSVHRVELGNSFIFANSSNAFNACYSLGSVYIPKGVRNMYDYSFNKCYSLDSVNVPDGVTSIGSYTFGYCYSLKSVSIPSSVTDIGSGAFQYCYCLESVNIPDGVPKISGMAFYNCYSLTHIIVPSSVTVVAQNSFNGCRSLRYVDFTSHTKIPTLDKTTAFGSLPADFEIRVPAALVDEWKAATNWSAIADKIVGV